MKSSTQKFSFGKEVNETYVCPRDGESFYILGHESTKSIEATVPGKSGAYAHLEPSPDPKVGKESVYNGSFW